MKNVDVDRGDYLTNQGGVNNNLICEREVQELFKFI